MAEIVEYASKVIPPMTHPYGKHWEQPELEKIIIGEEHALMTQKTLMELKEYSDSTPTGVYEGKMWRSKCAVEIGATHFCHGKIEVRHYLHWWSSASDPERCSHNARIILII